MDFSTSTFYPRLSTSPNDTAVTTPSLQSAKHPLALNASHLFCPLPPDADFDSDDTFGLQVLGNERYTYFRSLVASNQVLTHRQSLADVRASKDGILYDVMFPNKASPRLFKFEEAFEHADFPRLGEEHLEEIRAGLAEIESFQPQYMSTYEVPSLALALAYQAQIQAHACRLEAESEENFASKYPQCAVMALRHATEERNSQRRFEETAERYMNYAESFRTGQTFDLPASYTSDCNTLHARVEELRKNFQSVSDAFATQQAPEEVYKSLATHAVSTISNLHLDENTLKAIQAARQKAGRTSSSGVGRIGGRQGDFSLSSARRGGGVNKNRGRMTRR